MGEWEAMWRRIWAKLLGRPANFSIRPKAGAMKLEGQPVRLLSTVDWQFFAFVFAALVTLAFGIVDSLAPLMTPARSVTIKVITFAFFAGLTLWCWPFKRLLLRLLPGITTETR
jgi:hypothetical protein